jgi:hypothetical protein
MIKSRRWAGYVAYMGARRRRRMYLGFWWKSQKERATRKTQHRWVHNIKIDLRERGWDSMNWIDLAQDRNLWRALVNTVMKLLVP